MSLSHPRLKYFNTCQQCKTQFHPFAKTNKFCSYECHNNSRKTGKELNCANCGTRIYRKDYNLKRFGSHYCSIQCKDKFSLYQTDNKKLQRQARWAVLRAITKGLIKRKPCEQCGLPDGLAHHYRGYETENWLRVRWLCRSCHGRVHQDYVRQKAVAVVP